MCFESERSSESMKTSSNMSMNQTIHFTLIQSHEDEVVTSKLFSCVGVENADELPVWCWTDLVNPVSRACSTADSLTQPTRVSLPWQCPGEPLGGSICPEIDLQLAWLAATIRPRREKEREKLTSDYLKIHLKCIMFPGGVGGGGCKCVQQLQDARKWKK